MSERVNVESISSDYSNESTSLHFFLSNGTSIRYADSDTHRGVSMHHTARHDRPAFASVNADCNSQGTVNVFGTMAPNTGAEKWFDIQCDEVVSDSERADKFENLHAEILTENLRLVQQIQNLESDLRSAEAATDAARAIVATIAESLSDMQNKCESIYDF